MKQFPLFIDLDSTSIPIVGGGAAALRKARLIIAAGARPIFIWPWIEPTLRRELLGRAEFHYRLPELPDFMGANLAFIAVDETPGRWARMARSAGALVNVVDHPALCDFTTPSIVDRGALTVAISTGGAAPVLGRSLRAQIEISLPDRTDALVAFAGGYRAAVKAKFKEEDRRGFWEAFFGGPIAAQILAGDETAAHEAMLAAVNCPQEEQNTGVVHIVGAGPGDPDLLTLKAFRLIQKADVILYDRLVSEEVLSLARRDADRLYVGKAKANHVVAQAEIEATMIALARAGKNVVRLKGGDPFVFGRGGEELAAVREAGVPVTVTPGITAAMGCAAAAGMALTHRDHAQAVTFVTGHAKNNKDPALDWAALAALKNTLVVYMGVGKAASIAANLMAYGREATTPVAVIENGTRKNQIIVKGVLGDLASLIATGGVKGPALLVIGEVAALADGETLSSIAKQERLVA